MYCFVAEDLLNCTQSDPLSIQAEYAKHIGMFCRYSFEHDTITGSDGHRINLSGSEVFLRADYNNAIPAIQALRRKGVAVMETEESILAAERWSELPCVHRTVIPATCGMLRKGDFSKPLLDLLDSTDTVFVKSRKKGFSALVSSPSVMNCAPSWVQFLQMQCSSDTDALLISKKYDIAQDSLGRRESRHIVLKGKLCSSSRPIHSLKHAVPKSHIRKAGDVIAQLLDLPCFPLSFVLDIGEFGDGEETFLDVVEMNPLTSSLCYVNNSVFEVAAPDIEDIHARTKMGYEYCYDALSHPERYFAERYTGESFEYCDPNHYAFL